MRPCDNEFVPIATLRSTHHGPVHRAPIPPPHAGDAGLSRRQNAARRPEGFAAFRAAEGTRTPAAILAHIGDLFDWALAMADGRMEWHDSESLAWPDEKARFFRTLAAFDARLASGEPLGMTVEKLFQGPVADAFTTSARSPAAPHGRRAGAWRELLHGPHLHRQVGPISQCRVRILRSSSRYSFAFVRHRNSSRSPDRDVVALDLNFS